MSFEKNVEDAIINFKDIRANRANKAADTEKVPEAAEATEVVPVKPQLSREEKKKIMESKMDAAKLHGAREIRLFRSAVKQFRDSIKDMALFGDLDEVIELMFINQILESYTEPVFKGQCPYGIPESMFRKLRADMYKTLIKKYVDGEGSK